MHDDDIPETALRHVHKPLPHDSARKHVQGAADYVDDILEPENTLHVALGGSPAARGAIRKLDLTEVRQAPEVVAVITAADVPGKNDVSPVAGDEPLFAEERVSFREQPLFAVIAKSRDAARRAVALARIEIAAETPNVTVEQGRAAGETVLARLCLCRRRCQRGNRSGAAAPNRTVAHRRPGAFLPGGPGRLRHSRRGRCALGAFVDPAPERGSAYRRTRAWPAGFLRHLPGAADGRRLRRQGNASLALGRDCRSGGARDRAPLQAQARSRRRHADDRQAARFQRPLRGRLRAQRPHPRRRCGSRRALRLLRRPQPGRRRSRHVPCRQRLLPSGISHSFAAREDEHRFQYGVSRLRRPARHARDRARHRRDRVESRP